jgi:hypothetical protein
MLKIRPIALALFLLSSLAGTGCTVVKEQSPGVSSSAPRRLAARTFNSGFELAHDTYNGMCAASDGKIYYVLSSQSIDRGGQMYAYDPAADRLEHLGDLTEVCGGPPKAIPQGKSHVNFVEAGGKLFFATHIGYYSLVDGMEKMGIPPAGYQPYPGGCLVAYDMSRKSFEVLAAAPEKEGILTMSMDAARGRIYALTWPTGHFFRFDLAKKEMRDFGPVAEQGENGKGPTYRTLCRAIAVDPGDGSAYFTLSTGIILHYSYARDALEVLTGEDLRKDYFGCYDPNSPGTMGYNWRQVVWHPSGKVLYGVHGNSGYLFRFDPKAPRIDVLERITSEPSRLSGMYDQFSYGYLGFALGPDGETLYYLTGGPIYVEGRRVRGKENTAMGEAKGLEDLHLVTYHIPSRRYTDHGPVFYENGDRPLYVNSIAVGRDGTVYTLARITENGRTRADLVRIPSPFSAATHH